MKFSMHFIVVSMHLNSTVKVDLKIVSEKKNTGNKGEDLAAEFLVGKGWQILNRNFRFGYCEIDIIARKENWILFVEVKTRSCSYYGYPEEFVSSQQANCIFRAADEFVHRINWHGHIRFDIISIIPGVPPEVTHFEDAIN